MDENLDIVFALNTAAQHCPDVLMRRLGKEAAAELTRAKHEVMSCPSLFNLKQLNAATIRAVVTYKKIPPLPSDNTPQGSLRAGARLAA